MHRIAITFSVASLLLAPVASADEPRAFDPRAAHAASDKNADGYIDREEFHLRMVEVFYHADADRSGDCDKEELEVWNEEALFSRIDGDGDGRVSMYEFVNGRFQDFEDADVDDDGMLSVDEVTSHTE